jgi:hypothetical protein
MIDPSPLLVYGFVIPAVAQAGHLVVWRSLRRRR